MVQKSNDQPNRVVELFNNKTVFVTGGTGFLGKVLVEKLLRCTDVAKIYMLIRPKKGKSVVERLEGLFDGPLFDIVKKERGKSILAKVEPIAGDIAAPDLGISESDRKKLRQQVQFIFHSAATVRFDEPIRNAVFINVRGTKLMLALAKECVNLMAFCHVSTAYCQESQEVLQEKTYPPPADPHKIIDLCEGMDPKILEKISDQIRGDSANNYTFTKALGEALVNDQMDKLPVIIQRPSAVIPIWKEPLPGWCDNINGPMGILIGAGKGVIRTMYGRADNFADYIPVDIVANALMCTAYDYVTHKARRVYNFTSSDEYKLTFQEVMDIGRAAFFEAPFNWVMWYPSGCLQRFRLLHNITFVLFQLLPAILLDALLILFGFKPVLLKVQKRIAKGYRIFEYYTNRKWNFQKENVKTVRCLLNAKEKKMFVLEGDDMDYTAYFANCSLGARRYIFKEKDEDIPMARRNLQIMWFVDKLAKFLVLFGALYFLYNRLFN